MKTGTHTAQDTGKRGRDLVVSELQKRGAVVGTNEGRVNLLYARSADGNRQVTIRTKTKGPGSRVWQVNLKDAKSPEEPVEQDEFWILVDLAQSAPLFYVIPGPWFRRNIYETHQNYLELHGGERPVTPGSLHHSVEEFRIQPYENRWDLLQL